MKLYRIIYPVNDIEKAASFYSRILDSQGIRVSPGRHYFDLGGTILACYDPIKDGDDINAEWSFNPNQYIYISTTRLEEIYQLIVDDDCATVDSEIETMPWGESLFYAKDPSGNPLSFVDAETVFTG